MTLMLLVPLVLHFIADFLLQSREMGKKKSSEWRWLLKHLGIQFGVFMVVMPFLVAYKLCDRGAHEWPEFMNSPGFMTQFLIPLSLTVGGMFALVNTLVHGLIDWNIWKLYKLSAYMRIKKEAKEINASPEWIAEMGKNWQYWEDHWFYATIGFDQLLHTATIVVLAFWLLF